MLLLFLFYDEKELDQFDFQLMCDNEGNLICYIVLHMLPCKSNKQTGWAPWERRF